MALAVVLPVSARFVASGLTLVSGAGVGGLSSVTSARASFPDAEPCALTGESASSASCA
ncbi:hypothetical protein QCE62_26080 [Caballeronia sp. LZ033]|uniref:hypothetical protein n=1 Tax=Caballeronia sp. LZ033 TaxID=3038566 RepID=UPI0028628BC9|nr:hypothetical protein [Caballeronia sp. LZ033]MDR5817072.1 hypothetical protein [Caballeronia sp. LZ033]